MQNMIIMMNERISSLGEDFRGSFFLWECVFVLSSRGSLKGSVRKKGKWEIG